MIATFAIINILIPITEGIGIQAIKAVNMHMHAHACTISKNDKP